MKRRKDGRLALVLALAMSGLEAVLLAGGNTVEGVGQDFAAAGQGLADAARDSNPDYK